jgi:hypothetical protein
VIYDTLLNSRAVLERLDKARVRALRNMARFIYRGVRSGIKRRKKPSSPGAPVHTQTGFFKEAMFVELDAATGTYRIYPRIGDLRIFELHEHGGERKLVAFKWRQRVGGEWQYIEAAPVKQEAFEKLKAKYPKRISDAKVITVKYPKRSYLDSAVQKSKSDFLRKFPEDYRSALGPDRSVVGPGGSRI